MLREPTIVPQMQLRKDKTTGRFKVVKLEERIAPRGRPPEHAQSENKTK